MERPLWLLLAWTVFGVAAGIKLWRVALGLRRQFGNNATSASAFEATEPFRQSLERIWAKGEDA